jgi:hypothetical protein
MLKTRAVLLAKAETTYGVDAAPTAAANAILVENLAFSWDGARMAERVPVRASLGKVKPVFAGTLGQLTFDVEIKGSGAAGTAPELGVLLKACGFAETIDAGVSVTYKHASSAHASATLYFYEDGLLYVMTGARGMPTRSLQTGAVGKYSFTFSGHMECGGMAQAGAASTITLASTYPAVDDVFNGRTIKIVSGTGAGQSRTISDYVGSTKVATVSVAWITTPDATSVYSILGGPIDVALPTATYNATVPTPMIAAAFSIDSYAAVISKLDTDWGIEIAKPDNISGADGYGEIRITGRAVTGTVDPEATLVAAYDWVSKWKSSAGYALATGVIGTTAGNRYAVTQPAITYTELGAGDREGILTRELSYVAAESSGDDEDSIVFT